MKITACPKCGSRNIFQGTVGDGVLTGYTTKDVCRDCNYKGQPIIFDSENEYKKFLIDIKHISKDKNIVQNEKLTVEEQVDEVINNTKKDEEVVELLHEYEKEKASKPIWPKNKVWWPEIFLSFIFSAIILIFFYGPFFSTIMDINNLIVYCILLYFVSVLSSLSSIVLIEYFIRFIANVLRN